jgi:hypothetical protein
MSPRYTPAILVNEPEPKPHTEPTPRRYESGPEGSSITLGRSHVATLPDGVTTVELPAGTVLRCVK